jgi:hypothetical protein
MADTTDDDALNVLPLSRLSSSMLGDDVPVPDAVSSGDAAVDTPASSGAAPTAADAMTAGVPPAAAAAKPSTPVVSDLAQLGAIKKAVDSGDPLAIAAATSKSPDLAKLQQLQHLLSPAAATPGGGSPAAAAPPVPMPSAPPASAPGFSPIPALVSDVQSPDGLPPGAPSPSLPGAPVDGSPGAPVGIPAGAGPSPSAPFPPPPGPSSADAISGGTAPGVINTPGLTMSIDGPPRSVGALPPTDEYGQSLGAVAGMTDPQASQWAQNATPQAILEQKRLLDVRQRNQLLHRSAEADAENLRQLKQDQTDFAAANAAAQAKSNRIVADAIKMATTKTDPNRYLSTRSAGRRLLDIALAVAGGLVQARSGPGARNIGMDLVQKEIDKDIDAQKQDIENGNHALGIRQNAVAEEFKRNGNLFEATEKVRLATYEAVTRRLETEQQNFDPRGTSFISYATSINDLRGKAAEHVEKIREQSVKEDLEQRKEAREKATANSSITHQRREEGIAEARLGLDANKQKTDNQVWSPQQLSAINPGQPVPPIAMSNADYGKWLTNQKTGGELQQQAKQESDRQADRDRQFTIGSVTPRLATDKSGRPIAGPDGQPQLEYKPLTNDNGEPWRVADQGEHKVISDKYLAASEVSDIINEILDIRGKVGGESGVFNSDESQRLKVLQNRLTILQKSGTQGMSSDEDMNKLVAAAGAEDVSSFRDKAAGLKEALQRTSTELNKTLRIAKYTGPAISFANPYSAPAAKPTDQDIRDEDLLKKPAGVGDEDAAFKRDVLEEYRRQTIGMSPEERQTFEDLPLTDERLRTANLSYKPSPNGDVLGYDINESDPKRVKSNIELSLGQRQLINDVAARFDPNATIGQQRRIAELGQAARGDDAAADKARKLLEKVSTDAHTGRLRGLAKQALEDAATGSIPDTTAGGGPVTSSAAYETIPPPKGKR